MKGGCIGHWCLGSYYTNLVEFWAIRPSLRISHQHEFCNIEVESNSLVALQLIWESCHGAHLCDAPVLEINKFGHTLREANQVVNVLAKPALFMHCSFQLSTQLPSFLYIGDVNCFGFSWCF